MKSQRTLLTTFIFTLLIINYQLSIINCSAQPINIDIDENAQNRIMATEVRICDFDSHLNIAQSTLIVNNKQIPAFGLYQNLWDTLYIRSEKIEIPFFDNQLKIILVQEGNTPFAFPVSGTVSTGYIKNKGKQHAGVDFMVTKNEPVVACFDGVVRIANKFDEYGNTVVLRHYNGLETLYAMLENVCVVSGQKLNAGELLGHVTLPTQNQKNALHFETRFLNEFFNPEKIINFSERKLQNNLLLLTPADFLSIPVVLPNPAEKQIETKTDDKIQPMIEDSTPVYHTVQTGDTIFRICAKYKITEEQLRSLNQIKGNNIMIGQKLRVK
jgi:murein DD-endopeptidase MepM/ murein hydrolase activator NlpD